MYENGGNTTHRILDGHPELLTYPFESQIGTKYVFDYLTSLYPVKYRLPVFPSHLSPAEIYTSIIDEEVKIRTKTPLVSKFRHWPLKMTDKKRQDIFVKILKVKPPTRANCVLAFFEATFTAWTDMVKTGKERFYLGYSPIIGVDGDKIISDYKGEAYVIHIVRNPFSAYADTKKRAVPLSLSHYLTGWVTSQYFGQLFSQRMPDNFFVVRYEDIINDPEKALRPVFQRIGLKFSATLNYPSWNSQRLKHVYPWGTIRTPTETVNLQTARELTGQEIEEIRMRSNLYLEILGYQKIYQKIK